MSYRRNNSGGKVLLGLTSAVLITGAAVGAMYALDQAQISASDEKKDETVDKEETGEIEKIEAEKKALAEELEAVNEEKSELNNQIASLNKQIEDLEAEKVALETTNEANEEIIANLNEQISTLNEDKNTLNDRVISLNGNIKDLNLTISNLEEEIEQLRNENAGDTNRTSISLENPVMEISKYDALFVDSYTEDITSVDAEGNDIPFVMYRSQNSKSSYSIGDVINMHYVNGNEEGNDYADRIFNVVNDEAPFEIYQDGKLLETVTTLPAGSKQIFSLSSFKAISNLRLHNYGEELELNNIQIRKGTPSASGSLGMTFEANIDKENHYVMEGDMANESVIYQFNFSYVASDGTEVNRLYFYEFVSDDLVVMKSASEGSVTITGGAINEQDTYEFNFDALGDTNITFSIAKEGIDKGINPTSAYGEYIEVHCFISNSEYTIKRVYGYKLTGNNLIIITLNKNVDGVTKTVQIVLSSNYLNNLYKEHNQQQ